MEPEVDTKPMSRGISQIIIAQAPSCDMMQLACDHVCETRAEVQLVLCCADGDCFSKTIH